MLYRESESTPRHRLFLCAVLLRCPTPQTTALRWTTNGGPNLPDRPPATKPRFGDLVISRHRHGVIRVVLHLGNPAYQLVSVPKDLLTVRVLINGSVNLTRLTHVLRGDMAMLYASSNRREIAAPTPPTTCSNERSIVS
jgi:hypothetical protein